MDYARSISLDLGQDEAVELIRAALAEQGFGILTEIDVAATLAAKLDRKIEPCMIQRACNPTLAAQALDIEPAIGLLAPIAEEATRRLDAALATLAGSSG